MSAVSRRTFMKAAGAAAATIKASSTTAATAGDAKPAGKAAPARARSFLTAPEAATLAAMVERIIPSDDSGPGAKEAGVATYIDLQLAGPWGAGERLYRSGPWKAGEPSQGYQLPFTPAELFRHALRAIDDDLTRNRRTTFAQLPGQDQDAYLESLEKGGHDLGGVPSKVFFESLLELCVEGYFCDPVYGGNKDKVAWKAIGFPGAYANYYELVDRYNVAFTAPPISLAEDAHGVVHRQPFIPAQVVAVKGK